MYSVSEAFKTQMKKATRIEHLRGYIGSVPFADRNIISFSYSNRCSDTSDVTFGSCYIGQITLSLYDISIPRGSWRDKVVTVDYGLELPGNTIEWIPVGVFTVNEATWTDLGIEITASDILAKLDKPFPASTTYGSVYELLQMVARDCQLELGQTREEIEALPNGDQLLGLFSQNDVETYRDFISWIGSTVGGWIQASRTGKLLVKSFINSSIVDSLADRIRVIGSQFSDYETFYDGISIVNIADNTTSYYSAGLGEGAVINVGSNPLLQYGIYETLTAQRMAVARVANSIRYTPFKISILNNPAYDLGDRINCTGGVAGSEVLDCCIMSMEWSFKQTMQLEGYGADPALSSGKSKTDKALTGIMNRGSENELITYTFINAEEIVLQEDEEETIVYIQFATVNPKTVDFWCEIELETEFGSDPDIIEAEAHYYINENIEIYQPITSWNNDGFHLFHLMYFIDTLEGGKPYDFEIKLVMKKGSAIIAPGGIHASLRGQGLVAADEWSGKLDIRENLELHYDGIFTYSHLTETVELDDQSGSIIIPLDLTDNFELYYGGIIDLSQLDDNCNITMEKDVYNIVSEDLSYNLVSEDGNDQIISEE